jgi:hypothetical protein
MRGTNIAAFAATVVVNGLAGAVGLNGITTGAVSDLYPALTTPAGYVFSIWGVIYVLLGAFVIYQALPRQREKPFIGRIGPLFVLSSVLNIVWLFLWHYGLITLSVIPMFALLATLIAIYLRLRIGKSNVTSGEKLAVRLPFSVYLGWITVATIANVAAALVSVGWDGLGLTQVTWAILVLVIALAIASMVAFARKDIGYGLVLIWAYVGIAVKQSAYPTVALAAEVCAVLVAVALLAAILYSRIKR